MKMKTISPENIDDLFEDLWPGMLYVHDHKMKTLNSLKGIQKYFSRFKNHDELLYHLATLEGIGITIASGLIWSANQRTRVPFDKYTLTYALKLGILKTCKITGNYVNASKKIKEFCDKYDIIEGKRTRKYSIKDFVREAVVEMQKSEIPLIEPT
jgi:hypothetical protein